MQILRLAFIFLAFSLFSCGGGGGDKKATPITTNVTPTSNAGIDQIVDEESIVTLDGNGTDSDGTITSYSWSQTAGTTVSITNNTSASISFSAPNTSASISFSAPTTIEELTLTFKLTVTDDGNATATDSVDVIINPINVAPTVDAGQDQTVDEETEVTLTANAFDSDGYIISYHWEQIMGSTVTLTNENSETTTFITDGIEINEQLIFELTVVDNEKKSNTDAITIHVNALGDKDVLTGTFLDSPVANLGYQSDDLTLTGRTDSSGKFTYYSNHPTKFFIGDIFFPDVIASKYITPLQVFDASDLSDISTINMVRLLMSLDVDGEPNNGILISDQTHEYAKEMHVDFSSSTFDSDPNIINLLNNSGSVNTNIVDFSIAQAHLQRTLDIYFDNASYINKEDAFRIEASFTTECLYLEVIIGGNKYRSDGNEEFAETKGDSCLLSYDKTGDLGSYYHNFSCDDGMKAADSISLFVVADLTDEYCRTNASLTTGSVWVREHGRYRLIETVEQNVIKATGRWSPAGVLSTTLHFVDREMEHDHNDNRQIDP